MYKTKTRFEKVKCAACSKLISRNNMRRHLKKGCRGSTGAIQIALAKKTPRKQKRKTCSLCNKMYHRAYFPNHKCKAVPQAPVETKPVVKLANVSDGSTASYYELPNKATELQHLISYKDMNSQMGEIFRSCYRYGAASHSDKLRDAKKIKFYIEAEIERLEKWI